MLRETFIFLSKNPVARGFVRHAPFSKTVSRRFVSGETLDDAVRAVRVLNDRGLSASLDYLGESVTSKEEARAASDTYIAMLERIAAEKLNANVSIKLTQMGQDFDPDFMVGNVARILEKARDLGNFVRVDMEDSEHTQITLDYLRDVWNQGFRNVGAVIQAALYRSESDIAMLNSLGMRVRLCKGAYNEPATIAFPDKADVDANYIRLMKMLLTDGNYPGIATHDPAMIRATMEFARERGIPNTAFEFQMLYGIRRDLQEEIVKQGYNMRIYVPFGEAWYPYFMRRLAERPANVVFLVGNIIRESPLGGLFGANGKH